MRGLLAAGAVLLALDRGSGRGRLDEADRRHVPEHRRPVRGRASGHGTELIAYGEPQAGNLKVIRGNNTVTLASGLRSSATRRSPHRRHALLYAGEGTGVVPYGSTDEGASWAAGTPLPGTKTGDVQAAAFARRGPIFSQDGTGFIDVFNGSDRRARAECASLTAAAMRSRSPSTRPATRRLAFWSNATGQSGYLVRPAGRADVNLTGGKESARERRRVPLVADGSGNTFLGWQTGYPDANAYIVNTYRGGKPAHSVRFAHAFKQPDSHMALSVDAAGRIWALWTQDGAVWAARSRSQGAHFGAAVHVGRRAPSTSSRPGRCRRLRGRGDQHRLEPPGSAAPAEGSQRRPRRSRRASRRRLPGRGRDGEGRRQDA